MKGSCVAEIVESRSPKYKKGELVLGFFDLQNYQIVGTEMLYKIPAAYTRGNRERARDFLGVLGTAG